LSVTFLLGGLWHGAGWTFVIWGAMHGLAIAIHRFWSESGLKMPGFLGWFCTFFFVNVTWVFFRAESFESALRMTSSMFSVSEFSLSLRFLDQLSALMNVVLHNVFSVAVTAAAVSEWSILASGLALIAVVSGRNMMEKKEELIALRGFSLAHLCFYAVIITIALWVLLGSSSEVFLYFNF